MLWSETGAERCRWFDACLSKSEPEEDDMATKSKNKRKKAKARASSIAGRGRIGQNEATPKSIAEQHFVIGLMARGEAARLEKGHLPPGATHEIVAGTAEEPIIVRRRFSAA